MVESISAGAQAARGALADGNIGAKAKEARGAFEGAAKRVHKPSTGVVRSLLKPVTTITEGSGGSTKKVQGVPEGDNSQDQTHESDQLEAPRLGDRLDITT